MKTWLFCLPALLSLLVPSTVAEAFQPDLFFTAPADANRNLGTIYVAGRRRSHDPSDESNGIFPYNSEMLVCFASTARLQHVIMIGSQEDKPAGCESCAKGRIDPGKTGCAMVPALGRGVVAEPFVTFAFHDKGYTPWNKYEWDGQVAVCEGECLENFKAVCPGGRCTNLDEKRHGVPEVIF